MTAYDDILTVMTYFFTPTGHFWKLWNFFSFWISQHDWYWTIFLMWFWFIEINWGESRVSLTCKVSQLSRSSIEKSVNHSPKANPHNLLTATAWLWLIFQKPHFLTSTTNDLPRPNPFTNWFMNPSCSTSSKPSNRTAPYLTAGATQSSAGISHSHGAPLPACLPLYLGVSQRQSPPRRGVMMCLLPF